MVPFQEKIVPASLYIALLGLYFSWNKVQHTFPRWKVWASLLKTWRSATVRSTYIVLDDLPPTLRQKLDNKQRYFEAMGFDNLGDFVLQVNAMSTPAHAPTVPLAEPHVPTPKETTTTTYCRVMVHSELRCTLIVQGEEKAQGNQKSPSLRYVLFSRAGGWSYTTCTYKRDVNWLLSPCALWHEVILARLEKEHPGHSLWAMFNSHVGSCDFVAQTANLTWDAPLTLDEVVALECGNFERLRSFALHCSSAAFILRAIRIRRETMIFWAGELTGKH